MTRLINQMSWIVWLCVVAGTGLVYSGKLLSENSELQGDIPQETVPQSPLKNDDASEKIEQEAIAAAKMKAEWSKFSPPLDKKYDWIQLSSGEWLKGDLKVLYNYSFEFDSDELNLLKLDWEDIRRIRSAKPQSIRVESGHGDGKQTTLIGVLELNGSQGTVTFEDDVIKIERHQIVSIAQGTTNESDLWVGKLSFGMNIRSGNSDLVDANLSGNAKRRTAVSRIIVEYVGNFSRAEKIETSNNHRFNFQYDQFKSANFFWRPIYTEYVRDTFKNIDNQVAVGTAFGYHIIRTPKTEWEITGKVGALYKRYVSVEEGSDINNISPTAGFGTNYETDITKWLEYLIDFNFNVVDRDSGSYIHNLRTTLSTDITGDLDLDITFVWDRVKDPQAAADGGIPKKDDYQLMMGIGYEF